MIEPVDETKPEEKPGSKSEIKPVPEVDSGDQLTLDRPAAGPDVLSPRTGKPLRKYTRRSGAKPGKPSSGPKRGIRTPEQIIADKAILAQALSGAFQGLGVVLGPHWPLQTKEQPEVATEPVDQAAILAEVWDPVLERYSLADMEKFRDTMMWISALTVTVAFVKPRIEVTVKQQSGLFGWLKRKIVARRAK